jgi:hypothetical protein
VTGDTDMRTLDFLPPDPDLVNRIRQCLRAHKAGHRTRDLLSAAAAMPAAVPLAVRGNRGQPARPIMAAAPLQRAAG